MKSERAQGFLAEMQECLLQVKQPHFEIAKLLGQADFWDLHKELGYKNIYELSEAEFGFKKSSTAAYLGVVNKFCCKQFFDGDCKISFVPRYEPFSFSQLVEMLPMSDYDRTRMTPDMTVKQIRAWRKDHKVVTLENGAQKFWGELTDKQKQEYEEYKARPKQAKESVVFQTSGQTELSFLGHQLNVARLAGLIRDYLADYSISVPDDVALQVADKLYYEDEIFLPDKEGGAE